ncbi:MAG: acyltransferase [Alphaproteobacteria bacterium]
MGDPSVDRVGRRRAVDAIGGVLKISRPFSIYLDLLRVLAALAVLLGHMEQDGLYMAWIPLHHFNHEAVIVFFVLSGYVIAHSTFDRKKTCSAYAVARLARVYPVAAPAILFSAIVAAGFGQSFNAWDVVSSFLFLNESWLNPASLPMNGPYWSLCYEAWYYLLFGLAVFLPRRLQWICVVAAALAGPAILLLMPIWLLGVLLARKPSLLFKSQLFAFCAAVLGLLVIVAIGQMGSGIDVSLRLTLKEHIPGYWRLIYSQRFVTDYVIGLAVALHLTGMRSMMLGGLGDPIVSIAKPIRYMASGTFSIYLFHKPMTEIIGGVWPNDGGSISASLVAFTCILSMCMLAAHLTEHRAAAWRSLLASSLIRPWGHSSSPWRSQLRHSHSHSRDRAAATGRCRSTSRPSTRDLAA